MFIEISSGAAAWAAGQIWISHSNKTQQHGATLVLGTNSRQAG